MILFPSMEARSEQRFHHEGGKRFSDNLKNNGLITPDTETESHSQDKTGSWGVFVVVVGFEVLDDKSAL